MVHLSRLPHNRESRILAGMPRPNIAFFTELGPLALTELFDTPGLIDELATQQYGVSLAIMDFSPQRAAVARRLMGRGIRVVAWLLLPIEAGYWFNLQNYPQAIARYGDFHDWAVREDLTFYAVGLDFEPSLSELHAARQRGPLSLFDRAMLAQNNVLYPAARQAYLDLAAQIRHDGYELHTYQYPLIIDDRRAGTTLLQRTFDIVDLPADQEVLMLYSSTVFGNRMPDLASAFVKSYAELADGIAVGVTGGGVVIDPLTGLQSPRMTLEQFRRDLRIAAQYTDEVHIFSLEGCVERDWLPELRSVDWDRPVDIPMRYAAQMAIVRGAIGFVLWCARDGWTALGWLGWLVALALIVSRRFNSWRSKQR